jgi:hypothetical protein
MYPRSFTCSKAGILYVPDTNDIKIVTALLEYEFDTGDVSTRLSFDEIRERLSDISDDILVYAVDMLIRTKARFNLGGELRKVVGNMYIMVPVTAKLDTIIYGSI